MFEKIKRWDSFNGQTHNIKVKQGDIILGIARTPAYNKTGYFINNEPVKRGTAKYNKYIIQFIEMARIL